MTIRADGTRSVTIYLKPGIEDDDRVFATWAALRRNGRPQHMFRHALLIGLQALSERGDLNRLAQDALRTGNVTEHGKEPPRNSARRSTERERDDNLVEAKPVNPVTQMPAAVYPAPRPDSADGTTAQPRTNRKGQLGRLM